jgi:hypothetical protein
VEPTGVTEAEKLHEGVITARAQLRDVEDRHERGLVGITRGDCGDRAWIRGGGARVRTRCDGVAELAKDEWSLAAVGLSPVLSSTPPSNDEGHQS